MPVLHKGAVDPHLLVLRGRLPYQDGGVGDIVGRYLLEMMLSPRLVSCTEGGIVKPYNM